MEGSENRRYQHALRQGGKAGAARRHGIDGPQPPKKKINARSDAAKAINKSGGWLAHARTLRNDYLAGEAPVWELYAATGGAQQILKLEV